MRRNLKSINFDRRHLADSRIWKNQFHRLPSLSLLLQVYKTQLERVSEGWKSRIGDFERVNTSLQTEVTKLQLENQDLKSKVRDR